MYDLVAGHWGDTVGAAATRDSLFVVDKDTYLYRVDPRTGTYLEAVGQGSADRGWHARTMVASANDLFIFEPTGNVYRLSLVDHSITQLGETWRDVRTAAMIGDRLFAVANRTLYLIDPDTGDGGALDGTWDTRYLVGLGDSLYAWEADNNLYRVDPASGHGRALDGTWPHVTGASTACGQLFAVDNGILYRVDPETGACTPRGDRFHTRILAGGGSVLYSFEQSGELFRVSIG